MRRLELVSVTGELLRLDQAPFYAAPDIALSGLPKVAVASHAMLGGAGRTTGVRRHGTRDVPLRLQVLADSPEEFDDALARLAKAVDPVVGDVLIRFHRADGTARQIRASYIDGGANIGLRWAGSRESEVSLIFEAHDPYWRSVEQVEIDILATEFIGGGEPTAFDANIAFDADIPFDGFNASGLQTFVVDNQGDVDAFPRWDIAGPGKQLTAYNITTGKLWSYEPVLTAGRRLVVDTSPAARRVTVDDVNAWSGMSDESEMWPLVPGVNHIGVRVQEWSAGTSGLLLSWRDRYLTC